MKLPSDIVIAEEKLTEYLLVWRARNDKPGYLAQTVYELSNWPMLEADLRKLAVGTEAASERNTVFGEILSARGELEAPTALY